MGIDKEQLGINAEISKEFTLSEVSKLSDRVDDISIAQKTVNTRGIKELLTADVVLTPISGATTVGNPVTTSLNQTINLKESIENYNLLNIQVVVGSDERKFNAPIKSFYTNKIIYNNTNDMNYIDGSIIVIELNLPSGNPGSFGSLDIGLRGWFKTPTQFYIYEVINPLSNQYNKLVITSISGVNIENLTIDPVEYVNTTQGIEDTPVGNVISIMGKSAPSHYLICDGAIYNISDYPYLAQYFIDHFETSNFFGGDGITTFAVPDLRDEFLRGYHGNKIEKFSDEIGVHQNGTIIPGWYNNGYGKGLAVGINNSDVSTTDNTVSKAKNVDWEEMGDYGYMQLVGTLSTTAYPIRSFTARPTNTAVLYCIKYEPTYFMSIQGLIEETTLWEGSQYIECVNGTSVNPTIITGASLTLTDSVFNYDKIEVHYSWYNNTAAKLAIPHKYEMNSESLYIAPASDVEFIFNIINRYTMTVTARLSANNSIEFVYGFLDNKSYTSGTGMMFTKVVGVKYKTDQSGN